MSVSAIAMERQVTSEIRERNRVLETARKSVEKAQKLARQAEIKRQQDVRAAEQELGRSLGRSRGRSRGRDYDSGPDMGF
ncbi:hypothetical protein [Acetobacter sp. LMG 32666]|uniref:hypothetical protein n=1 Tax=Acetobacter sp. LMG 32666 TaxID=2959295 RepID=UPI0030C7D1AC